MSNINNIHIVVQARSTSKRLPNKVMMPLGGRPILDHMIYIANNAAKYHNKYSYKNKSMVYVAFAIPFGDPIGEYLEKKGERVIRGPEDDVLTRYYYALNELKATHIVRITADCPMLPPYIISKHITLATIGGYDYISNVDERIRTFCDGFDVEVISEKLLNYVNETATDKEDREHVTTFIRKSPPSWAKLGCTVNFIDSSSLKLSVDCEEDYKKVTENFTSTNEKRSTAEKLFGKAHVHKF